MTFPITTLYAIPLALFFVALSAFVIAARVRTGINTGDGGNIDLIVAMRRQGNAAEYIPFALLMIGLAEAAGAPAAWLHVSGLLLLLGRLVHPFGIAAENGSEAARIGGQTATFGAIIIPAILIILSHVG